jgi:hypothetical protein
LAWAAESFTIKNKDLSSFGNQAQVFLIEYADRA